MSEPLSPPLFREALVQPGPWTLTDSWQRWLSSFWQQAQTTAGNTPGPGPWQPLDSTLTALAALTGTPDTLAYFTATEAMALTPLTAYGRSVIGSADASGLGGLLGLGTMAYQNANAVNITGGSGNFTAFLSTNYAPATGRAFQVWPGNAYIQALGIGRHFNPDPPAGGRLEVAGSSYFAGNVGVAAVTPSAVHFRTVWGAMDAVSLARGDAQPRWALDCEGMAQFGNSTGFGYAPVGGMSIRAGNSHFDSAGFGYAGGGGYSIHAGNTFLDELRVDGLCHLHGNVMVGGWSSAANAFKLGVIGSAYVSAQIGVQRTPQGHLALSIGQNKAGDQFGIHIQAFGSDVNHYGLILANAAGAGVGSITYDGTTTAYNTSSDARLKEQVEELPEALPTIMRLDPVRFRWKADGSVGHGLIAQEVQAVVPGVVTGKEDGDVPLQIDYSKLVPWLIGAVQTLAEQVEALTARAGG